MLFGYSIAFPKLGIVIEQLNKSFEIGGFRIAYYGVLIGLGGACYYNVKLVRTRQK